MATSVDPKHARLPLPGGREDATVAVEPLLCGEVQAPPVFFDRPASRLALVRGMLAPRSRWSWVPVPAFLVHHPGVGAILVDTGFHPSVATDPKRNLGPIAGRVQRIRMDHDQAVPVQLEQRGILPGEVRVVVMTHLHFDHASGVSELPESTFVVDRREWDAASSGGVREGYNERHIDHAFDWQTIDFAARQIDSFASFGGAADLFGDGSVRLLATPGHTAGHMSVLLRLASGELLLTGDAIYSHESLDRDLEPLFCADRHLYRRSRAELRRFAQQTPTALIVPGHDPAVWPTLAARYE
jgi:glyoxylase-like metal-dependent hydrolase (beta-lactamase superfamily II)